MSRRLVTVLAALAALAVLPASAAAGGIVATLESGQAPPLVGKPSRLHVTIEGCAAFDQFGVDSDAPRLVLLHARSGRSVIATLHENRAVVRSEDYPNLQRYIATVRLPRAGLWTARIRVAAAYRSDAFGFEVRARRAARR